MAPPVPVARLIVTDALGRVLVLRRSNTSHGAGRWALPGGKIDYGETAVAAAVRELEEETGLRCAQPEFLFYQDSLPHEPGLMHCINLYFECEISGALRLNDEASESAWALPKDLDRFALMFGGGEGVRRWVAGRSK